jgi:hypothetical protein
VDISPAADGSQMVPLTNQMLYDAFTNATDMADSTQHPNFATAMNIALGVRMLQLGSRSVVVEVANFDFHSQELSGRYLYRYLGRTWAALYEVLRRIPDPDVPGKSLLDLCLCYFMSDFGRDPGFATTGRNAGEGTDHGTDPSCYYLAQPVMGGGVKKNQFFSPVDTANYRADLLPIAQQYSERQFLAMLLYALGLDSQNPEFGFADVTNPIAEAFT